MYYLLCRCLKKKKKSTRLLRSRGSSTLKVCIKNCRNTPGTILCLYSYFLCPVVPTHNGPRCRCARQGKITRNDEVLGGQWRCYGSGITRCLQDRPNVLLSSRRTVSTRKHTDGEEYISTKIAYSGYSNIMFIDAFVHYTTRSSDKICEYETAVPRGRSLYRCGVYAYIYIYKQSFLSQIRLRTVRMVLQFRWMYRY